jgi:dTDP-4-amino-4,6-dideoxygalactose transaminase
MTPSRDVSPAAPAGIPVPALNLAAQFANLSDELAPELAAVAASGAYVLGPKVAAFEEALANYCGTRHALGLSSGTDALLVALMTLGIGPGDEVIVPTFTFFATAGTVVRIGARPVFCDIDPRTFNLDVAQVERLITPRTRAIIPVHLYGQLADLPRLLELARRRGVLVIEDAAQAIGAQDADRRRAGSLGTFGALSFYPTKNLGALGDAGALLTNDQELFEIARKLRVHGSGHTYYHDRVGGNFRIDALQAAILTIKLKHLEQWNQQRRARAARYTELISAADLAPEHVRPPLEVHGCHVYHQYVVRARRRDELVTFLRDRQIGAAVYYPLPLHLQKCFADLGYKPGDLPQAEQAAAEVLALPIYPELTDGQQQAVVESLGAFYRP